MKGFDWVKRASRKLSDQAEDLKDTLADEYTAEKGSPWLKISLTIVGVYLLLTLLLGWNWTEEPEHFDVNDNALARADRVVVGSTTAAALVEVVNVLLEKRGGYLSNDIHLPAFGWITFPIGNTAHYFRFGILAKPCVKRSVVHNHNPPKIRIWH